MYSSDLNNLPIEKNLLLIGGSGRNVGKTTLALEVIKRAAKISAVTGLKVSAFKRGEEQFHGIHHDFPTSGFRITEEKGELPNKDTARMLSAGASNAYFIESPDYMIPEAWTSFNNSCNPQNLPVVCESRSLRKYVKPGLFILLINPGNIKDNSAGYSGLADHVHFFKGDIADIQELAKRIHLTPEGWTMD